MKVPGWLLRIISSYLSNRMLEIRYLKETSSQKEMPGGAAAGTILGLNLFLILFNGAGPKASSIGIGQQITRPVNTRTSIPKSKVKWIDDMTLCNAVDLKTALVPENRPVPRPLTYHGRTEHRLPWDRNTMQDDLDSLLNYTNSHLMAINETKTKAMLCNSRIKWDVMPELSFNGRDNIEIVDELKIVGYVLRNDMKTISNTIYLTKKAYKRLWLIRRLKALGASVSQLVDCLQKQVLSVLWLGAPAWSCQLTMGERKDFDRVAKVGLKIIFGDNYNGFENALQRANILKPTDQFIKMTKQFATKSSKHPKFSKWFVPKQEDSICTRSKKPTFIPVPCRTERYKKSPIPHLTALLNNQ